MFLILDISNSVSNVSRIRLRLLPENLNKEKWAIFSYI